MYMDNEDVADPLRPEELRRARQRVKGVSEAFCKASC